MKRTEALKLALGALEYVCRHYCSNIPEPVNSAITAIKEALAQQSNEQIEPPPWWPAVENILNEYGLQAIDFVADFKRALTQSEQEPCKTCGGTGEVETGIGMMVCDECHGTTYTTPPQSKEPEQEPVAHTAVFHCPNCEYPHRQVTHITGTAQPPWSPQRKEQEPVAWMHPEWRNYTRAPSPSVTPKEGWTPLYTPPPQRTWVGLTDEDIDKAWHQVSFASSKGLVELRREYARALEAKLKEKNT